MNYFRKYRIVVFCLALTFLILGFHGCEIDTKTYSDIPFIEFKSAQAELTTDLLGNHIKKVSLAFYLIDGDGDIGLTQYDTVPPYDANFFPTLFVLKNNEFVEDTSILLSNYRIPYVGPPGQDPTFKAYVIVDFEYTDLKYDTVMYSFYLFDRALNKSNIAWSDTLVFLK